MMDNLQVRQLKTYATLGQMVDMKIEKKRTVKYKERWYKWKKKKKWHKKIMVGKNYYLLKSIRVFY